MNKEIDWDTDPDGLLNVFVLTLVVIWLGAIDFRIAGASINIFLVAAVVLLFIRLFRKAV